MKVPWLPKQMIAQMAGEVLLGYEAETGRPIAPPIQAEDIIERYFQLDLVYLDFYQTHGLENIFGALYVKEKTIAISESLLQDESEGRLIFTCAHEIGHWCLHRQLVDVAGRSTGEGGVVLCRSDKSSRKLPIEWQADYFAGCLLMPEEMVHSAWGRAFENDCIPICNTKKSFKTVELPNFTSFDPCVENWYIIADIVRTAGNFTNVSKQSMIIRLQELGLVKNLTQENMNWKALLTERAIYKY